MATQKKFKKKNKPGQQKVISTATAKKEERPGMSPKDPVYSKRLLPGSWKINLLVFALLAVATCVLYAGDLHIGFFDLDDAGYVTDDPWIKSFSAENIARILSGPYFANYSPLHLFSYMIDYAIGGTDPVIYHASSNIWAGLVAGLVFLVALNFSRSYFVSIAASILFVVHPVHVEAIAWISSRKDLVAAAFILPSFLAYIKYRSATQRKTLWYVLSVLFFLLALAGKLSAATFPGVLLAMDFFVEKRPLQKSIVDKIPFLLCAALFALIVSGAQPPSGHHPDPNRLTSVFLQNMWLLTGFGTYVLYRVPPGDAGILIQLLCAVFLLAVFILPFFLKKRFPKYAVLFYWLLFTFIPAQALSFMHPVTDRYLFLPSVAFVILVPLIIFDLTKKLGRNGKIISSVIVLLIAALWTKNTLNYLREWEDPRSVWYTAVKESNDAQVFWGLAVRYQDISDKLGMAPRGKRLSEKEEEDAANVIWANNPKLPQLIAEFQQGKHDGPVEKEFQKYLRSLAWDQSELAVQRKTDDRVMPVIYFRRGLILYDNGDREKAKKEFYAAIDEANRHSIVEAKEEYLVRAYNALGIVAWSEGNYKEALRLMTIADTEQKRSNGNWVPELEGNLKQLKGMPGIK